jgi:hypothetical protein
VIVSDQDLEQTILQRSNRYQAYLLQVYLESEERLSHPVTDINWHSQADIKALVSFLREAVESPVNHKMRLG